MSLKHINNQFIIHNHQYHLFMHHQEYQDHQHQFQWIMLLYMDKKIRWLMQDIIHWVMYLQSI